MFLKTARWIVPIGMSPILIGYIRPEPTTWVVLSIFAVIGLFFVFHRFWSMRNLDILLILAFVPGFMMVYEGRRATIVETALASGVPLAASVDGDTREGGANGGEAAEETVHHADATVVSESANAGGQSPDDRRVGSDPNGSESETPQTETTSATPVLVSAAPIHAGRSLLYWGFLNLLICAGLLAARMLLDTAIVRRPLLEPNLNSGGMLFIGTSLLVFLLVNVATSTREEHRQQGPDLGPGYVLLSALPKIPTDHFEIVDGKPETAKADIPNTVRDARLDMTARILTIASNLALICSIVGIGYWHFGSFNTGVGAATLYLLLPYTAFTMGRVDHVVPGALLLLALLMYRQPLIAGLFLGCAAGVTYYPFSLLPLWCSFYWPRGIRRFAMGFVTALVALIIAMAVLQPTDLAIHLGYMFGIKPVAMTDMDGVWGLGWHPFIRIPIIVLFVLLSMSFVVWPAQKNLATLMSCTAALMAATQFWHGFGGGLYMSWFLPLAILTVFRPNLDYLVALEVVRPWKRRAKPIKSELVDNSNLAA